MRLDNKCKLDVQPGALVIMATQIFSNATYETFTFDYLARTESFKLNEFLS